MTETAGVRGKTKISLLGQGRMLPDGQPLKEQGTSLLDHTTSSTLCLMPPPRMLLQQHVYALTHLAPATKQSYQSLIAPFPSLTLLAHQSHVHIARILSWPNATFCRNQSSSMVTSFQTQPGLMLATSSYLQCPGALELKEQRTPGWNASPLDWTQKVSPAISICSTLWGTALPSAQLQQESHLAYFPTYA